MDTVTVAAMIDTMTMTADEEEEATRNGNGMMGRVMGRRIQRRVKRMGMGIVNSEFFFSFSFSLFFWFGFRRKGWEGLVMCVRCDLGCDLLMCLICDGIVGNIENIGNIVVEMMMVVMGMVVMMGGGGVRLVVLGVCFR